MRFIVTSPCNSASGEVFFSVLDKHEIEKAYEKAALLCRGKAGELYKGQNDRVLARLDCELAYLKATDTAFHFLLLKEISDYSKELGYPVFARGTFSGSLIAYLLGISSVNPMPPHYCCQNPGCRYYEEDDSVSDGYDLTEKICPHCSAELTGDGHNIPAEMFWGAPVRQEISDFEIGIAPFVRSELQRRLDTSFGNLKDNGSSLFYKITVPDSCRCELIGTLSEKTGLSCFSVPMHETALYPLVLNSEDMPEYMRSLKPESFAELIRILGFLHGTWSMPKRLEYIKNPHFSTTREDLYRLFLSYGIPKEQAYSLIKTGTYRKNNEKSESVIKTYHIPEETAEFYKNTRYLFPKSHNVSWSQICYIELWYEHHFPKEYTEVTA